MLARLLESLKKKGLFDLATDLFSLPNSVEACQFYRKWSADLSPGQLFGRWVEAVMRY